MDSLTEKFKAFAAEKRADLIGIAPIERFDDVSANHHPCSIFPETKSVIVVGKRITRGTLRGMEEGTQLDSYSQYGVNWLKDRMLAMCTVSLATFFEDQGWEAVPLQDLPPQVPPSGIAVKPGLPAPNVMVDAKDAAVRAGLGEIGLSGQLLTPRFGPRQRLQMILTDAELTPTPLCTAEICDGCGECAKTCPLDAIDLEKVETVNVCGKEMKVASVNFEICKHCLNGAHPNPNHSAGEPDRLGALCTRSCVDHLERFKRVENQFANQFRQRPAWQVDRTGRSSLQQ